MAYELRHSKPSANVSDPSKEARSSRRGRALQPGLAKMGSLDRAGPQQSPDEQGEVGETERRGGVYQAGAKQRQRCRGKAGEDLIRRQ